MRKEKCTYSAGLTHSAVVTTPSTGMVLMHVGFQKPTSWTTNKTNSSKANPVTKAIAKTQAAKAPNSIRIPSIISTRNTISTPSIIPALVLAPNRSATTSKSITAKVSITPSASTTAGNKARVDSSKAQAHSKAAIPAAANRASNASRAVTCHGLPRIARGSLFCFSLHLGSCSSFSMLTQRSACAPSCCTDGWPVIAACTARRAHGTAGMKPCTTSGICCALGLWCWQCICSSSLPAAPNLAGHLHRQSPMLIALLPTALKTSTNGAP